MHNLYNINRFVLQGSGILLGGFVRYKYLFTPSQVIIIGDGVSTHHPL